MQMFDPPHPGEILKEMYLKPLNISVTAFAENIGVRRATVSSLINKKSSITPMMAVRLGKALKTTPDLWLGLQMEYDLWQIKQETRNNKAIENINTLIA
ncbi:MAG: addiction module antidote protein, HigA family [Candidatus Melainabacteria bacterium GWF2_37_15]|nr:MAG: addiction module antidote protein, HigA family [Candidatus Melainabacteria bacterium GWF2_37_15]